MRIKTLLLTIFSAVLLVAPGILIAADIPEPDPEKGIVYLYRPDVLTGKAVRFTVNENGKEIGALNAGTTIIRYLEPGEYTYFSQAISKDAILLQVEAGQIYFVKGTTPIGLVVARPKFHIMSEEAARNDIAKLK